MKKTLKIILIIFIATISLETLTVPFSKLNSISLKAYFLTNDLLFNNLKTKEYYNYLIYPADYERDIIEDIEEYGEHVVIGNHPFFLYFSNDVTVLTKRYYLIDLFLSIINF